MSAKSADDITAPPLFALNTATVQSAENWSNADERSGQDE
jgi:hypothetical protein